MFLEQVYVDGNRHQSAFTNKVSRLMVREGSQYQHSIFCLHSETLIDVVP